jgi:HAMP domain-containing protein
MFAGGLVGFFIAWLASPWFARPQRRMERFARKHRGVASLEIDIELDSAIIHS